MTPDPASGLSSRADQLIAELVEALDGVVRCFDLSNGLSVRDEQAIKHGAAGLAVKAHLERTDHADR